MVVVVVVVQGDLGKVADESYKAPAGCYSSFGAGRHLGMYILPIHTSAIVGGQRQLVWSLKGHPHTWLDIHRLPGSKQLAHEGGYSMFSMHQVQSMSPAG